MVWSWENGTLQPVGGIIIFLVGVFLGSVLTKATPSSGAPVRSGNHILFTNHTGYGCGMTRFKVPQGWLVYAHDSLTYVPDPDHEWK